MIDFKNLFYFRLEVSWGIAALQMVVGEGIKSYSPVKAVLFVLPPTRGNNKHLVLRFLLRTKRIQLVL